MVTAHPRPRTLTAVVAMAGVLLAVGIIIGGASRNAATGAATPDGTGLAEVDATIDPCTLLTPEDVSDALTRGLPEGSSSEVITLPLGGCSHTVTTNETYRTVGVSPVRRLSDDAAGADATATAYAALAEALGGRVVDIPGTDGTVLVTSAFTQIEVAVGDRAASIVFFNQPGTDVDKVMRLGQLADLVASRLPR